MLNFAIGHVKFLEHSHPWSHVQQILGAQFQRVTDLYHPCKPAILSVSWIPLSCSGIQPTPIPFKVSSLTPHFFKIQSLFVHTNYSQISKSINITTEEVCLKVHSSGVWETGMHRPHFINTVCKNIVWKCRQNLATSFFCPKTLKTTNYACTK